MARGPGIKLKGRERDRVLSEYMELLPSQDPTAAKLPGAKPLAIVLGVFSLLPLLLFAAAHLMGVRASGQVWIIGASALTVLLFSLLLSTGIIGPRRRLWWVAMRKCGHNVCAICGYWLEHRAADSHACPECGTPDDTQPVPLGERRGTAEWPRFEVDPPPAPGTREAEQMPPPRRGDGVRGDP